MIITKEVETKWSTKNKQWYISKGYNFTKIRDILIVKVSDLQDNSHVKVEVLCDYCNINITYKEYRKTFKNKEYVDKDCCEECIELKIKEVNNILYSNKEFVEDKINKFKKTSLSKYGYEHPSQSQVVKNKAKQTNLIKYGFESHNQSPQVKEHKKESYINKYGVSSPFNSEEIREKIKNTNLSKYGVENPMQNEEVKLKTQKTNLIRYGYVTPSKNKNVQLKMNNTIKMKYGVDNISQLEEVKNKKVDTTLKHYGVEHHMQNKDIQNKAFIKRNNTMFANGQGICSSQQIYLNNILKGVINYPVSNLMLDIKLDDEIYVEYDGGGHNLNVLLKEITQHDFNLNEIKRYHFLKEQGWKMIKIVSKKDYLPSEKTILEMIQKAKDYIKTGHSWVVFDIDNSKFITSIFEEDYNFGEIKKISKNNLKDIC